MPIDIVDDLPDPMVLGHDWAKIWQVLDVVRAQSENRLGLAGEEVDDTSEQDGPDLESLFSSSHF